MICKKCDTEIAKTADYVKLIQRFKAARNFLECHPATGMGTISTFESNFCYCAEPVCKRGHYKPFKGLISLYYNKEDYKKYKELFDKEIAECPPDPPGMKIFAKIEVPYETHFGEPWKFDHIEWWGELSFTLFTGKDVNEYHDIKNWGSYQGVSVTANSFEELVIATAAKFRKVFGDFSEEDFLTGREKKNHEKESPFDFEPLKEKKGYSEMKQNKKYLKVTAAEINLRWKKWFLKTDYAKKHWSDIK